MYVHPKCVSIQKKRYVLLLTISITCGDLLRSPKSKLHFGFILYIQ